MLTNEFREKRILSLARVYRTEDTAKAYLDYVRTRGRKRRSEFPTWEEVSQRMSEYR
jgi:hypothetical protein